jgi:hypothetical protein
MSRWSRDLPPISATSPASAPPLIDAATARIDRARLRAELRYLTQSCGWTHRDALIRLMQKARLQTKWARQEIADRTRAAPRAKPRWKRRRKPRPHGTPTTSPHSRRSFRAGSSARSATHGVRRTSAPCTAARSRSRANGRAPRIARRPSEPGAIAPAHPTVPTSAGGWSARTPPRSPRSRTCREKPATTAAAI